MNFKDIDKSFRQINTDLNEINKGIKQQKKESQKKIEQCHASNTKTNVYGYAKRERKRKVNPIGP